MRKGLKLRRPANRRKSAKYKCRCMKITMMCISSRQSLVQKGRQKKWHLFHNKLNKKRCKLNSPRFPQPKTISWCKIIYWWRQLNKNKMGCPCRILCKACQCLALRIRWWEWCRSQFSRCSLQQTRPFLNNNKLQQILPRWCPHLSKPRSTRKNVRLMKNTGLKNKMSRNKIGTTKVRWMVTLSMLSKTQTENCWTIWRTTQTCWKYLPHFSTTHKCNSSLAKKIWKRLVV